MKDVEDFEFNKKEDEDKEDMYRLLELLDYSEIKEEPLSKEDSSEEGKYYDAKEEE